MKEGQKHKPLKARRPSRTLPRWSILYSEKLRNPVTIERKSESDTKAEDINE